MPVAASSKKVYFKATAGAPSAGDEPIGITNATHPTNRNLAEKTAYSDGIYTTRFALLADMKGSVEGQEELADAPQNLVRAAVISGATIYYTVLDNGVNGFTYPVLVESYDPKGSAGEMCLFSAALALNGAPVAVP